VSAAARRARLGRPRGSVPTAAVVGPVDAAALAAVAAAGWQVRGVLAPSPFADLPLEDRVGYLDPDELCADGRVDAAVVAGEDPAAAGLLPRLRRAGLVTLLPTPAPLDVGDVLAARAVAGPEAAVGLVQRWTGWARTAAAALPLAGPPVQVTVRGWPRGPAAAAELVDVVAGWCGEVVAVAATPGPLPAERLPGGERVAWSLLTGSGATVLVAHEGPGPRVRVTTAAARLEVEPDAVRWEGGDVLPLARPPSWAPPAPEGTDPGLVATAAALADAVGGAEVRGAEAPGAGRVGVPAAAGLADLLVVARVLEALRTAARTEALVPVA
jgi:hypothetical protein